MLKIIYHEDYLTPYFTSVAESPRRVSIIYKKLSERYETVTPDAASREDVLRVHTVEHLEKVQQERIETYRTALLSAGGALCAARLAIKGIPAFAVIRPPGHHAGRSRFGGFCFFNNIAIAVAFLLESEAVEKVLIVDSDMHRGDGTQDIFCDNPSVFIIDIRANDRHSYLERLAYELHRIPAPDLIAVSAGFDLYVHDWGGLLETSDFHRIGYSIYCKAQETAGGRCFAVLEGGYFLNELGKNALAFCRGLEGKPN